MGRSGHKSERKVVAGFTAERRLEAMRRRVGASRTPSRTYRTASRMGPMA